MSMCGALAAGPLVSPLVGRLVGGAEAGEPSDAGTFEEILVADIDSTPIDEEMPLN